MGVVVPNNDNVEKYTFGKHLHDFILKFSDGSKQKAREMEKDLIHGILLPNFGVKNPNIPSDLKIHRNTQEQNQLQRTMFVDCCINGCMVFVGIDKKLVRQVLILTFKEIALTLILRGRPVMIRRFAKFVVAISAARKIKQEKEKQKEE